MLTRALQRGEEEFARLFRYAFQLMLYLSIPIALWATWFAEDIIAWIYTDRYAVAAPVLMVLVWAGVGGFASHLSGYALVILNRQKVGVYVGAAALCLNVILNLVLIRIWGIWGAAVATLVTEAFVVVIGYSLCFHYARVLPFSILMLRCVVLAAVVTVFLALGRENAIVSSILIFGLVSLSFFYFLRGKDALLLHEFMESK